MTDLLFLIKMIPPKHIPKNLYNQFTLNSSIPVSNWYFDNTKHSPNKVYSNQEIDNLVIQASNRETKYYKQTDTFLYNALDKYSLIDKSCVIIGSQTPWYEAIAIHYGVKSCTTIEYQDIQFQHPKIKTLTPEKYKNNPEFFDLCISISSIEHDGLGRYGDRLNPNGDLEVMRQIQNILNKDALFFLSIPVGVDRLVWNAHRIYGKIRLPLLLHGWKVLSSFGFKPEYLESYDSAYRCIQPVFVLQKI